MSEPWDEFGGPWILEYLRKAVPTKPGEDLIEAVRVALIKEALHVYPRQGDAGAILGMSSRMINYWAQKFRAEAATPVLQAKFVGQMSGKEDIE